jgi:hypothetical protein
MNAQVLQLLISVGGIAVMVGLCRALFGHTTTPLPDADALAEKLAHDIPGFRAGRIALSRDAEAALAEDLRDGAVYLVLARGDGVVIRRLVRGIGVARDGQRVALQFRDFTLKGARLDLADAEGWETRLKGLGA